MAGFQVGLTLFEVVPHHVGNAHQGEGDQQVEREGSNVNLEEEVPEMMVTQRAYEANLKVLQTQDRMLGTLMDIMG